MVGSNRSFGYDAAASFANFIATPSLWDAFAIRSVIPTIPVTQVATNDHVLLSFLSHLVYSATGSRSEVVYRILPALGGGATVAVATAYLVRQFGLAAGLAAGVFIATDPMFVDNSRDLRGYSLAALGCVAGTLLLGGGRRPPELRRRVAYALVMGLAIAAQLFAAVVLLCHAAWLLSAGRRDRALAFTPAWVAAAALGAAANASIYYLELTRHGLPPPLFNASFPLELALFLTGAPVLLAVAVWVPALGLGLWTVRREPAAWIVVGVVAVVVVVLWAAVRPAFLYPRFFIFLVPALGYVVASAVKRWWVLAPVVAVGAAAAIAGQAPDYTRDPLALPQAAAAVHEIARSGGRACVVHSDEQILSAYTRDFTVVTVPGQLDGCDAVVVVSWGVDLALRDEAARRFPRLTTLPAYYPAVVLRR